MEKIFTVDYFIDKFEKIPERLWCTGSKGWYGNTENNGKTFCADGFCKADANKTSAESIALRNLLLILDTKKYDTHISKIHKEEIVYSFNDGHMNNYQQKTPKKRILAALRDVKKIQESSQMPISEPNVHECDATKPIVAPSAWPNKQSSLTNLIPIVDEVVDVKNVKIETVK